jgi:hypothetical protein
MAQDYGAAGFANVPPIETDYFFGDVPQSVETLKDHILIYRPKPLSRFVLKI